MQSALEQEEGEDMGQGTVGGLLQHPRQPEGRAATAAPGQVSQPWGQAHG